MRKLLYIFTLALAISSCSFKEEIKKEDIAGQVAFEYYKALSGGRYNDYVSGMLDADSIDSAYRYQLIDNAAMFYETLKKNHKGIAHLELNSATYNKEHNIVEAFITIVFCDSIREEVVVPMVERNEKWYMK